MGLIIRRVYKPFRLFSKYLPGIWGMNMMIIIAITFTR